MPIVKGNPSADIKIAVSAEMDKASAQKVQAAVKALSTDERAAIEKQIEGERLLARVEAERSARLDAIAKKQAAALKAQEDAQNRYRASLMKSREEAERLQQVSQRAVVAGAAIMAPFIAATQKFVTSANSADPVARQYRASMKSLEDSAVRLGRVTADTLNPALKATAEIVSGMVGVMEKNPAIVQGVLGLGGGLAAVGTIGSVVAQVKMITSTLALLTGAGSAAAGVTAAGSIATGTVAGGSIAAAATAAIPVVVPLLLTAAGIALIWKAVEMYGEQHPATPAQKTAIASNFRPENQFGGGGFFGGDPFASTRAAAGIEQSRLLHSQALGNSYGKPGGLIGPAQPTESQNAIARAVMLREAEVAAIEKEANEKRVAGLKDYQAKRESIEADIAATTEKYLDADKNAYKDYYNQRMDVARAAGIDAERAEEDHQKALRKIQRDSDQRIYGMRLERDALGIATEKRNAEAQRKENEESYQTEIRRKNQDLAERLRIMDREFAIANQRRLAEYNWNIKLKNAEVDAAYKAYTAIVEGAYKMVAGVSAAMSAAEALRATYATAAQVSAPTRAAAAVASSAGGSGRNIVRAYASGTDYVPRTGPAVVHEGELILNRGNRQMAENLIGGPLSQSGILELVRSASRGGSGAVINNNFGGTVTVRQVAQMVDQSAQSLVKSIQRGLKAA